MSSSSAGTSGSGATSSYYNGGSGGPTCPTVSPTIVTTPASSPTCTSDVPIAVVEGDLFIMDFAQGGSHVQAVTG